MNKGENVIEGFKTTEGSFAVGQSISGPGIPPGTTITELGVTTARLSQPITETATATLFGDNLAGDSSAAEVEASLNALPSIGGVGGSVTVTGGPGDESGSAPYMIEFGGALAGEDLHQIVPTGNGLTVVGGTGSATVSTIADGGAYEVCEAAAGDICKAGRAGSGVGEVGEGNGFYDQSAQAITVSQPDGNPSVGTVFLADTGNHRVSTYNIDGSSPGSFGSTTFAERQPVGVAVDSRGIVYASNSKNSNEIERYDTQNADGNGVGFLPPIPASSLNSNAETFGLAVEPDADGSGPDADVLYALRSASNIRVLQFGPLNAPGLFAPPPTADAEHGTTSELGGWGLATDEFDGRLYVTAEFHAGQEASGVYVLDNPSPPPTATLDSLGDVTSHSVTAQATINPNGPPATSYRFEYSTDGTSWKSTPSVLLGSQKTPQPVEATLDPPGGGLEPNSLYHVRLVAKRPLIKEIVTPELTFTTLPAAPSVETTGLAGAHCHRGPLGRSDRSKWHTDNLSLRIRPPGPLRRQPLRHDPTPSCGLGA